MLIGTRCRGARQAAAVPKTRILTGLFLALMLSTFLLGQDRAQEDINRSCRDFVGAFYAGHSALLHRQVPALELAFKYERGAFSPDLLLQLREDSEAQKKAGGEIVGLDFDPILACQDCGIGTNVEKTTIKGDRCWAEVHGGRDEAGNSELRVIPELVMKDGKWTFFNFHYPNPERPEFENLLSLLKSLREYRARLADVESKKR